MRPGCSPWRQQIWLIRSASSASYAMQGILTEEEFNAKKVDLLARM